jgi:hypothetical protein
MGTHNTTRHTKHDACEVRRHSCTHTIARGVMREYGGCEGHRRCSARRAGHWQGGDRVRTTAPNAGCKPRHARTAEVNPHGWGQRDGPATYLTTFEGDATGGRLSNVVRPVSSRNDRAFATWNASPVSAAAFTKPKTSVLDRGLHVIAQHTKVLDDERVDAALHLRAEEATVHELLCVYHAQRKSMLLGQRQRQRQRQRQLLFIITTSLMAARHAASFNDMTMDTCDGEGHHDAVVGSAVNASGAVSTTMHGDAWSPMGVASTTVADSSRLSTLQRSSSHDAQSSL